MELAADPDKTFNISKDLILFLCETNPNYIEHRAKVGIYTNLLKDYKAWYIYCKEKEMIAAVMIIDNDVFMNKSKYFHLLSIEVSPQYERNSFGSSILRKWAKENDDCKNWSIYVTCPNIDNNGDFIPEGILSMLDSGKVPG